MNIDGQTTTAKKRLALEDAPSCPYAKALKSEDFSSVAAAADDSGSITSLPGLTELRACPAFRDKECPFKGLPAEEVTEKLRQIPPSHLEANGTFHKTLEFFHHHQNELQQSTNSAHAQVKVKVGVCPVKHALPVDFSFDKALEEFSLASIMGNLAREFETTNAHPDEEEVGSSSDGEGSTRSLPPVAPPEAEGTIATERTSLSQALKSGTAIAHEAAESVHFVKNFIRGKIDRNLYALLVAQLFHVYAKLEDALDTHAPTCFAKCHFPKELRRTATLQEDVEFWHTTADPPISPAAQDYIERITYLEHHNPLLLLSHAYTRYMGDLSGGKVLARVARRALNLSPEDAGLAFYHFENVQSFKLFKDKYRASLNALNLTDDEIQQLVQEANVAFLLNMRLFEELDVIDNVPNASVRALEEVYSLSKESATRTPTAGQEKCPFIAKQNSPTASSSVVQQKSHGVCPWPFILLHDPQAGMKKWQTWLVIGLFLAGIHQLLA
jgi:heme oxygenase